MCHPCIMNKGISLQKYWINDMGELYIPVPEYLSILMLCMLCLPSAVLLVTFCHSSSLQKKSIIQLSKASLPVVVVLNYMPRVWVEWKKPGGPPEIMWSCSPRCCLWSAVGLLVQGPGEHHLAANTCSALFQLQLTP